MNEVKRLINDLYGCSTGTAQGCANCSHFSEGNCYHELAREAATALKKLTEGFWPMGKPRPKN